jgi:two-component system alkaline phosphatase synthesis response regulator PhoP
LQIDKDKYEISVDGKVKVFPRKEFEVLYYLANHPGRVFNRETLLKEVWGPNIFVVDRTVDVHIRKIREKLGEFSDLIETVKGVGYRFKSVE